MNYGDAEIGNYRLHVGAPTVLHDMSGVTADV
jgi:hypothetical protein